MRKSKNTGRRLSEEDKKLDQDLGLLIAGLLLSYEAWREGVRGKPKSRSVVAANCLFIAARQADSIRLLIKFSKIDSAMILLRALIETYINCAYICIVKDKSNLVRFMYSGDKDTLDNTKKYQQFVKDTYTKPKYTEEMFQDLIDKYEDAIRETAEHGFPLRKIPDLRQRVGFLLQTTGCPDFGELYFNSYLLLCENTHSSAATMAEIGMSPDFESRWYGRDLGQVGDTLSITSGILSSIFLFAKKNVNPTGLDTNAILTDELLQKHNRYIEYPQLKTLRENT